MSLLPGLLAATACVGSTPTPSAGPLSIVQYDLSYTNHLKATDRFEHVHTVAALAGLINRDGPRMFTPLLVPGGAVDNGSPADVYWRAYLSKPGEWLADATWKNVTTLPALLAAFPSGADADAAGLAPAPTSVVLYDPAVPATSSLASTAAGVEGLLPVCYRPGVAGSVYELLVASGPKLPVQLNLTGLFLIGPRKPTAKIQAYRWARTRWLATDVPVSRRANPAKLGYYADYWAAQQGDRLGANAGLTEVSNHDYFIAHKAFFFDLSVWADEVPVDDPKQSPLGQDKEELVAIFDAAYTLTQAVDYTGPTMLHVGGFTPWWFKYTQDGPGGKNVSKHKGVETEWETMGVIGAYNAFDDGDACCVGSMANSAFYQHYPLPKEFKQNTKPTVATLKTKGYVTADGKVKAQAYAAYYGGDYDGSAWLYNQLMQNWDDPKRGHIP
jgi:hypothetical protein